ncbi:MAG: hypothetical protein ABF330_06685 [Lentimonas sp.]
MCNLYFTMLDKAGVHVPRVGVSSGLLQVVQGYITLFYFLW